MPELPELFGVPELFDVPELVSDELGLFAEPELVLFVLEFNPEVPEPEVELELSDVPPELLFKLFVLVLLLPLLLVMELLSMLLSLLLL